MKKNLLYLFLLLAFFNTKIEAQSSPQPPCPIIIPNATVLTNEPCFGYTDGSANAAPSGGMTPYTYAWTPSGGSLATASNLSAGTYTITVTDNNGCTGSASVSITQPTALVAPTSSTNTICGDSNGTASVTVSGGTPLYTYLWSNGQTNFMATGLSAGTYLVSVTDANGCNINGSVTVGSTSPVSVSITSTTDLQCHGVCDGAATVSASGGRAPYTYSWAPSGGSNASATGLCAGVYTVTVKDNNGCETQVLVNITQPTPVTGTIMSTGVICNGGNTGTATVNPSGGTPAYTYLWTPSSQTNITATGLTAGSYTVTITDNHGCTGSVSVTITQPPPVTGTIAFTAPSCNGGNNGTATVTPSGGASPYTYSWSTIPAQTNATATGLTAGSYTVNITDVNGCTGSASVTVTQPAVVSATFTTTGVLCFGGSTGTATATGTGGTPAYTYAWNIIPAQTNATATGLSAGNYTVTVTDSHNCTGTASVTVTQPTVLATTITPSDPLCNGDIGSATAVPTGGTSPYTYAWVPAGGTNVTATGLSVGCYTVTVTDHNGCTTSQSVCLTQPTVLVVGAVNTNLLCHGYSTATATATPGGGTPAYTYTWNPGGQTNAIATGLSAGTYTVTLKDSHGCTATASVDVTQPTAVTGTILFTAPLCNGGNTGTATVTPSGGTSPYSYSWSTLPAQTNATATGLTAGNYTVTITDANSCTGSASVTVTQPLAVSGMFTTTGVLCNGGSTGTATVSGTGGTPAYTYAWNILPSQTNATATGLSAGNYTVTVTDNHGCTGTASVSVSQPIVLTASITPAYPLCNGDLGSATAVPNGGTAAYTYSWTTLPVQTNVTATGLTIGSYTVTVTDHNGCTASASVTITQPTVLAVPLPLHTNVLCHGDSTATATANPSGGTPAYTYKWTPGGQTTITATGLSAGTYTITVKDHNGCTMTSTVVITQPVLLTVMTTADSSGCKNNSGVATAIPSGGTGTYTYTWTNGQTTANNTGLGAGTYTISVTDQNGCSATGTAVITQPLVVTLSASQEICEGVTRTLTATGGGKYLWGDGTTNNSITVTPATGTTYSVIVSKDGCTDTAYSTVTVDNLSINACCDATIQPGTSTNMTSSSSGHIIHYKWIPQEGLNCDTCPNVIATPTATTTYTVILTDALGCIIEDTITVTLEFPCADFKIPNVFTPTNPGPSGVDNEFYISVTDFGITNWSIEIVDRWGKPVYNSTNPTQYWQGKMGSGGEAPGGVYYYILNFTCQGVAYKKDGYVQLIR